MKMVAHKAVGVNLPFGLAAGFTEGAKEALAIMDVAKDVLTPITAIHDMINSSWVFDAQRRGMKLNLFRRGRNCQESTKDKN